MKPERVAKPTETRVLMSVRPDGKAISFFGDLHPSFSGNVVKAMGSAKRGYPVVSRVLAKSPPPSHDAEDLVGELECRTAGDGAEVVRLTPNIVEVVVKAPMAARAFEPGQFYRLQNFESLALRTDGHDARDGGAGVDRRIGRSRAWIVVDDRARDGRIVRSLRAAEARRTRNADGSDGHTDGDTGRRNGAAGWRRTR